MTTMTLRCIVTIELHCMSVLIAMYSYHVCDVMTTTRFCISCPWKMLPRIPESSDIDQARPVSVILDMSAR